MVDIDSLIANVMTLTPAELGVILVKIRAARDDLQTQLLAALATDPPGPTEEISNDFALVNTWIRTLDAAILPNPPADATNDLLGAMQAVDTAADSSAAMGGILVAVDGLVQSFKAA